MGLTPCYSVHPQQSHAATTQLALTCRIQFDPLKLAKYANLEALFSIVPDRDLKKEAFEQAKIKDYSLPET